LYEWILLELRGECGIASEHFGGRVGNDDLSLGGNDERVLGPHIESSGHYLNGRVGAHLRIDRSRDLGPIVWTRRQHRELKPLGPADEIELREELVRKVAVLMGENVFPGIRRKVLGERDLAKVPPLGLGERSSKLLLSGRCAELDTVRSGRHTHLFLEFLPRDLLDLSVLHVE
jgi:hypothetical protein